MTAKSSFAPLRRNSLLRRSSSSSLAKIHPAVFGKVTITLLFLAFGFWKRRLPNKTNWKEWWKQFFFGIPVNNPQTSPTNPSVVLQFWFGQFPPEQAQKQLWMIAHSSLPLRQKVDQDITQKFQSTLIDLCNSNDNHTWQQWCDPTRGYQGKIAAIVVLDQMSRHIHRYHQENNAQQQPPTLPCQKTCDALALKTAQLLVKEHESEITCGMIPLPMCVFGVMPFRHESTLESVTWLQQDVLPTWNYLHTTQMNALLGRFRKATQRRLALLQDEDRRTGGAQNQSTDHNNHNGCTLFSDHDILETFPFDADMGPAAQHPCTKTIQQFLMDRDIASYSKFPVLISLSGGVDSMVIASVLAYFQKQQIFENLELWAVHIDYANRPESKAEAEFARRYCEETLGNIHFQCRRIDEVTRGITARDDYERIARELRYTTYKETISKAQRECGDNEDNHPTEVVTPSIGVMLGHHRGDLRENVLSNAHKGCGPLDLSGMTAVSRNDGVLIYRPLLPLEKTAIFDYAHKFGVPYFKDTTPHWSTRGKLRNQLLPLLADIYGEGSMKNLSNLAVESDECRALLQTSMIGPFLERIERYPMGIVLETAPWKSQAVFFWKVVLREALHSARFGMFSDKSVLSFLERVQVDQPKEGWLQCRRDYAVYLQGDGRVYVLHPSSFPFAKKDMFDVVGQTVAFGEERRVGPWKVTAEIITEKADCPETFCLAQKALQSMDHLMTGVLEYMVEVPTWKEAGGFVPRPLVFCRFTKATRPSAWKNSENNRNLYLKVQETLPLLGNDEVALAATLNPLGSGCVQEDEVGEKQLNPKRLVRVKLYLEME